MRVEYMGASVRRLVHLNYVIAAALSGIGGALVAMSIGHIDPDIAYWTTSGEFVFIAILSGTGNVVAPFLGALVFEWINTVAYQYTPNTWQMTLGTAMLLVIMFLPDGLWSLFTRRQGRVNGRSSRRSGLNKNFGAVTAAADLTVRIEQDSVVGLIGTNGAGKTTFINMITGYLKPDRGSISYDGRDITALVPREITRLGICRSFQIPQLFGTLTVRENLLVALGVVVTQREGVAERRRRAPATASTRSPTRCSSASACRSTATGWPACCPTACASCSTSR